VSRLLVVAAALCLVAGAVLGAWGWEDREASARRIVPTPESRGGLGVFEGSEGRREEACQRLFAVATLQVPRPEASGWPGGPGEPGGAPRSSEADPEQVARTFALLLDPGMIEDVPELAQDPEVVRTMADLRAALRRVIDEQRDPYQDRDVSQAAGALGLALIAVC